MLLRNLVNLALPTLVQTPSNVIWFHLISENGNYNVLTEQCSHFNLNILELTLVVRKLETLVYAMVLLTKMIFAKCLWVKRKWWLTTKKSAREKNSASLTLKIWLLIIHLKKWRRWWTKVWHNWKLVVTREMTSSFNTTVFKAQRKLKSSGTNLASFQF
jgi:hypothetical protein